MKNNISTPGANMTIRVAMTALVGLSVLVSPGLVPGRAWAAADTNATPPPSPQPAPDPRLPTLFVIGDSTANNTSGRGWGDHAADYFDLKKINVLNRARAGRSSRTFQTEGLWDKVLAGVKRGDFVLIQFGHNDGGAINDTNRARDSLPGLGEETQEIDNLITHKHEVVHTFGWYLRKFVADTKAKGATPIVFSLTVRNIWKDGKVERGSGSFGKWAAEVARSQGVDFVDLTTIVADQYEKFGQEKVKALFSTDHTHTSPEGAELNAKSVVSGLKGLKEHPLNDYLSDKGKAVAPCTPDPAK
jgi:lysophospholipase L1-like esterase